jgi:hypothetical protein
MKTRISADEAHDARKDHLREGPDGQECLLKTARAPASWDATRRSARFVMSSQTKDRYGDIVVTAGIDTSNFESNPQAYLNHQSDSWPIGTWQNIEKQLRGRPPRMEGDLVIHKSGGPIPQIDQAAWMVEQGGMRAASIGFLPDWKQVEKVLEDDGNWQGGLQFNKTELAECSLCGVPANPDALAKSVAANIGIPAELLEHVFETWERTPDGLIVPRLEIRSANWKCGCVRDLPISDSDAWDGAAAAGRLLDAAGVGGDSPKYAEAAKGFLAHDSASPDLRASYKLPFADLVGGKLTAMPGGLRAAASRLPQTDIPQNVMTEARGVLDAYFSRMNGKILLDFAERELAKEGKVIVDQSRVEAIERAAKQKRLEDKRQREKILRERKIELLKQSG